MNGVAIHHPVMRVAVVEALHIQAAGKTDGIYLDATFGRGGHSAAILSQLGPGGRLLVMDRDPEAIVAARAMAAHEPRLGVIDRRFGELGEELESRGLTGGVDGMVFDLGLSSPQLEDESRGFGFRGEGPLDMRMDPRAGVSAADWINKASESELADAMFHYGEERYSRRIAARIVRERTAAPIRTTARLAEIIARALPGRERRKHPATRAFQGIRIRINEELDELRRGLAGALGGLRAGGRLAVISFHSLEDRIVKRFMACPGDDLPRGLPVRESEMQSGKPRAELRPLGKPRRASAAEVARNPRARSAVLRVAEKL